MRILHLVARSHRRGAELVALELAEELEVLGHRNRVVALAPADTGDVDPQLPPLAWRRDAATWPAPDALARLVCVVRLRQLVAADPVDVVLAHGGWPTSTAAFALGRGGPGLVWQRILGFPDALWQGPRRALWSAVARRIDAAVALTAADETEMRRLGFRGPVWVIPNFRRPERFLAVDRTEASRALRAAIGVSAETELVAFVGHLVRQKRPERAVVVLEELLRRGRAAHLVVAGDGPLRAEVEREVHARGLQRCVSMLGHRHDVELVFGGVDVTILTSDFEGMPGVAIEAQMAGCPLVSFPVGGVDEVIDDGVSGTVLTRRDPLLMADHVARLLADPERRARMELAARARGARFGARQSAATYDAHLRAHFEHPERAALGPAAAPSEPSGRKRKVAAPLPEVLPNLFVLGAPKAGTTFLHQALRLAPDVYMSDVKEPGFFVSREYERGLEHYARAYFRGAQGVARRGESTPWYLYSAAARERIAALPLSSVPKLIVLVRRPADRARSMHRDQTRIGREARSFEEAVADELGALERGEELDDPRLRYLWCGLYSQHIDAWEARFGEDAIEVVVFEDLVSDSSAVWQQLAAFLEQDLGPSMFDRVDPRDRNVEGDLRWPRVDRVLRSFEGRQLRAVEMAKRALPPGTHRRLLQGFGRVNRDSRSERTEVDLGTMTGLDAFFAAERGRVEARLGRPIEAWRRERVPVQT